MTTMQTNVRQTDASQQRRYAPGKISTEGAELLALRNRIHDRIGGLKISSIVMDTVVTEFYAKNIDCLRCFDKFLISDQPRLVFIIQNCQRAAAKIGLVGSEFLTQEMLDGTARIYDSLPNMAAIGKQDELNAILFLNMDRADEIFFLVEEHGIIDPIELESYLTGGALGTTPKPLWNGAL